jgi:synaptobrevin family protein YKT6
MIFGIGVLIRIDSTKAHFLARVDDYSYFGFFKKNTVHEFVTLIIRTGVQSYHYEELFLTLTDTRYDVDMAIHLLTDPEHRYFIYMVTDTNYTSSVAKMIMTDIKNDFNANYLMKLPSIKNDILINIPLLTDIMTKYQESASYSRIEDVKGKIEDVKEIMIKNIELILERGEKIQTLVQKSTDLSESSKRFYKATRKLKRCCFIL